jgi:hypothetical protein
MTDNYRYNQYDTNRAAHKTSQDTFKVLSRFAYDAMKFLINFAKSMIQMVVGK